MKDEKTSIDSTAQVRTKEQDHCTAAIIDTQKQSNATLLKGLQCVNDGSEKIACFERV